MTPRQREVCDAIVTLTERMGHPPTLREVGAFLGTLPSDVHQKLARLRRDGRVEWKPHQCRTLRVVK
jgi:SOS-response transcriptional repressor LexA